MVVKRHLLLLLALACLASLSAQNVTVSSSLRRGTISLSDQLQLDLEIVSDAKLDLPTPAAPKLPEFSYRNVLSSSSMQSYMINGVQTSRYTLSFTYIYLPQKVGSFRIPGFRIRIAGRDHNTPELRVEVEDSAPMPPQQQYNYDPYFDPFGEAYPDRSRSQGETVLLCLPESQNLWLGEPVVVSYYLYTNQQIDSFFTEAEQDYPGYGKSVYEQPQNLVYEDVRYKERRFRRALIKSSVIYPQKAGRLQLPTLTGKIQFYGYYSYLNRVVDSSTAHVNVKSLPEGKPAGFTGAVGKFSASQSYSESKLTLGEALTCTIQIYGRGNFSQFTAPEFPQLQNFQISEPSLDDRLRNPIEGTRQIVYTLLPRETGEYELPGVSFSWFDTASGSYQSLTVPRQTLQVQQGSLLSGFSGLLEKEKPKSLKPLLDRRYYPNFRAYGTRPWYWSILLAMLLSLIVSGFMAHNIRLSRDDPEAYEQKTAGRVLNKYLREASAAARGLSQDFYPLAESGLTQFLAKKYGVSRSLGTEELLQALREKDLPPELIEQLEDFLLLCQKARYMPGGAEATALDQALLKLRSLVQAFSRRRVNSKDSSRASNNAAGIPEEQQ